MNVRARECLIENTLFVFPTLGSPILGLGYSTAARAWGTLKWNLFHQHNRIFMRNYCQGLKLYFLELFIFYDAFSFILFIILSILNTRSWKISITLNSYTGFFVFYPTTVFCCCLASRYKILIEDLQRFIGTTGTKYHTFFTLFYQESSKVTTFLKSIGFPYTDIWHPIITLFLGRIYERQGTWMPNRKHTFRFPNTREPNFGFGL